MLSERSATERVHFSVPERPFRSRPGDVALIFSSCFFFFCIKTKEEEKPIRMANLKKQEESNNSVSQKHPQIQSKTLRRLKLLNNF